MWIDGKVALDHMYMADSRNSEVAYVNEFLMMPNKELDIDDRLVREWNAIIDMDFKVDRDNWFIWHDKLSLSIVKSKSRKTPECHGN